MALKTPEEFIQSIADLDLEIYLFGEKVDDYVNHPVIRPSLNCIAMTYELARQPEYEDLMLATSHLTGTKVNRFTHIHQSTEDLVKKVKMQRLLGQKTGSCFQRCVGMDAINALWSVTHDTDQAKGTDYHERFKKYVLFLQENDLVADGAMTDPKGDRSKSPSQQADPDMYLHVVEKRDDGIVVRGAKAHQTGSCNSHEIMVMPTIAMRPGDEDYAVSFSTPSNAKGISYIYGRQSCDTRKLEGNELDVGNSRFGGHEALMVFDDVFVPWDRVYMCGEIEFSGSLVERFGGYHRQSYGGCKVGVGDVLIGAASLAAEYNGAAKASHVKDKIIEMTHLTRRSSRAASLAPPRGTRPPPATTRSTCCWRTSASRTSRASPTRSRVWPRTSPAASWSPCRRPRTSPARRPARWSRSTLSASATRRSSTACASCASSRTSRSAPPPWVTAPRACTAPARRRHSAS